MNVTQSIFKSYDIRGTVGTELTDEVAEAIGKATADWLPRKGPVAVGYDMRPDSKSLAAAARAGLTGQGRDIVDIGEVTSDMIYFAVGFLDLAGGIMVTASHNPGKDNGLKIYRDEVIAVGLDSGLAEIRDAIVADKYDPKASVLGKTTKHDITDEWVKHCLRFVTTPLKPYRIAIDAGNGMAGAILPVIQPHLGLDITEMYYKLDGTFPNHDANPQIDKNLADLVAKVRQSELDFGLAFDGDGDRAVLVDDLGRRVPGSDLATMVARHYLSLNPGAVIVHDVRTSRATRELITEWGGKALRTKAGRVNIAPLMREHNSPFGVETTGHLFFKENYFADSGLIAALVAMVALTESGQKLSELVDSYHLYAMDQEMNFKVADPKAVLDRLAEKYHDADLDRLDGLTVDYPDWWFNLRASNTEPIIRLNIEAKDEELLREKTAEVEAVINGADHA